MPPYLTRLSILVLTAAACVRAELPRPEYPEPQFQRPQWLSLNGPWHFAFDEGEQGIAQHWYAGPLKSARTITVPYCVESLLGGIHDTGFHTALWYQRSFTIPAAWKGKQVLLHFGAVYYEASVWLNGRFLGSHTGGNVPFSWDITAHLNATNNVLTVRALNPATDRSIARGKQYWELKSAKIFYTRTSGIWQPVWLEATGENHLRFVHVTAGADGVAHFEGALASRSQTPLRLSIKLFDGENQVAETEAQISLDQVKAEIHVDHPKLWSPAAPNLYTVKYELRQGANVLDQADSYIGFRTITITDGRVAINGSPIYLKFILDQGYWPETVLTPPSDAAIQRDIELAQSMGFNGVRKHQKVEDPRFLYWADRRGLLVSGEIADAYEFTDEEVGRFTAEWTGAVERDYNHPSIIIWNAINESWGVPDLSQPRQQAFLKEMYQLTHALDTTRLVIDNEGWQHTDQTDLFAIHDYAKPGETLYEKYSDVRPNSTSFPKNGRDALLPGYRYNGAPIYLSEFGGVAYIPPGTEMSTESWGYSGIEKTRESALARLTQLYEGIAKTKTIVGICYTQLTDVEQEANGLVTFHREPKFKAEEIKKLNDLLQ
jgi:beta-galactosidase/beta-glucuronidase